MSSDAYAPVRTVYVRTKDATLLLLRNSRGGTSQAPMGKLEGASIHSCISATTCSLAALFTILCLRLCECHLSSVIKGFPVQCHQQMYTAHACMYFLHESAIVYAELVRYLLLANL